MLFRFVAVFCLLSVLPALADDLESALDRAATVLTAEALLETVDLLASESMGGRLPGSPGYKRAAKAMAARFAAMGLQPAGDDGFFQHLPMEYNQVLAPCTLTLRPDAGPAVECHLGPDFVCRGFTGSGQFTAPVVFCGYGLSFPEHGYDDYADVDVTGKVVLVYKDAPKWKLDSTDWQDQTNPRPKAQTASDHGAIGLLMVSRPHAKGPRPMVGSVYHGPGDYLPNMPQLHISDAAAATLLASSGLDLADLTARIDSTQAPASTALAAQVSVNVTADYEKDRDVVNVVAMLPGTDPKLSDEYLVIGAHLDHVGHQADTLFYPGANDNASGSAAVVSVAQAFVDGGIRPRRSILFVLFAGEEQGLHGARHYADNPRRSLSKTVAMFNLDCVACGDSLRVGNGKSVPQLWQLARNLDQANDKRMTNATWAGGGADATPFHNQGVPCLYFVTKNTYTHLHLPTDTVETLNGPLYESMARLVLRTAAVVADGQYEREAIVSPESTPR